MAFNNEKLNPGEHFIYNGIEFICLDVIDGNYLAMTAKIWKELPFDENANNNFKESSLRTKLNTEFLNLLNKEHLVKQSSDLIADNGDKSYGFSEDYVAILSCDQYRKYREIVPLFDEWMWTLTPWTCKTPYSGYAGDVRYVSPDGSVYYYYAYNTGGVAPACIFSSKNLKLRRQAHLVGVDEDE